jgi:2-dehydropantoate 2-reductase
LGIENEAVLIVGSGAMACLFAARLSAAGVKVTLAGSWRESLEAIRREGVRLSLPDGSTAAYPVETADDPAQIGEVQQALVLVKSWQTEKAAKMLRGCLSRQGVALTLQNGMGNRQMLAEHLGAERVALGISTVGAYLLAPGHVRFGGEGILSLGVHDRIQPLSERLRQAGFTVEMAPDPDSLLWGKLVINAAINPLSALLNVPNGELLERPTARALMINLAREAAAVAAAQRIPLPYDHAAQTVQDIARRTGSNISSMLQDVRRGAPTEIDAICGAIVQAGEQAGVPTPLNQTMWQLIKALVYSPPTISSMDKP